MSTDNNQLPPLPEPFMAQFGKVSAEVYTPWADQMHAYAIAALAQRQGEPVAWEYRTWNEENTVNPGWTPWERVQPRNPYTDTVTDRVRELEGYIASGHKYELRALCTAPATAEAVAWQWRIDGGAEWHPASREWAEQIMAGQGAQGMQARALGVITATAEQRPNVVDALLAAAKVACDMLTLAKALISIDRAMEGHTAPAAPVAEATVYLYCQDHKGEVAGKCWNAAHVSFKDGVLDALKPGDVLPMFAGPVTAPVAEVLTDAIAAGDGALHGAIDYWQNRALAAEAGRDADETNAVLASNYIALCARLESGAEVLADAQMEEGLNSYEWESVPHPFRTSVAFERGVRFAERAHGIAAMSAAPPVPTADSPDPHKDSAKALLSAAQEFFREGSRVGVQGAVRWVTYEDGSLVIFTRGEYLDTLLKNISDTGISSVHHFAAPPAPAKVLTDRDIDGLLHALNSHARHYGDEYGLPCDAPHELSHMRKLVRYHIAAMAASSAPEGKAT